MQVFGFTHPIKYGDKWPEKPQGAKEYGIKLLTKKCKVK